jgi:hypothetical protein
LKARPPSRRADCHRCGPAPRLFWSPAPTALFHVPYPAEVAPLCSCARQDAFARGGELDLRAQAASGSLLRSAPPTALLRRPYPAEVAHAAGTSEVPFACVGEIDRRTQAIRDWCIRSPLTKRRSPQSQCALAPSRVSGPGKRMAEMRRVGRGPNYARARRCGGGRHRL